MKVTYLPLTLQAALLMTTGLLISNLAGATLRPVLAAPTPAHASATLTAGPRTRPRLLPPRTIGFTSRTETVAQLWRVDDRRDREDEGGDRYRGNIGDRGNYGNYGNRGNYGNFGDRGVGGDRGNYGDRRNDSEDRDR